MLHKSDKLNFLNKNGLVPGCVNKVELGREFTFSYHGATLRTGPGRGLLLVAGGKLCLCVDMMLISKFQVSRMKEGSHSGHGQVAVCSNQLISHHNHDL